jgi:Co/Zn/Cd efflux system component
MYALAQSTEWLPYLVQPSEWIVSALMLIVVAWQRFNTPPTNRSGTTFALFSFGLIFYYALIVALWLLVTIAVRQGTIGFDKASVWFGGSNPKAQGEFAPYAPLVAAFVIVVAAYFPWVQRVDNLAREFCINLAAIPREADRLTLELAQTADFQPKSELVRAQVAKIITETIGPQALNFEPDGSTAARFTRAVGLYWLFVGPNSRGMKIEVASGNTRSAYARVMQLGAATAARVDARYEELMQAALAYFTTPRPTKELTEELNRSITEVSHLTCSLIARYVLCCNATKSKRRQRLARMGFDASHTMMLRFGLDQWVATILAVIVLSAAIMAFMPGTLPRSAGQILQIAITFGLSIGFAVIGAVVVAHRLIERYEGEKPPYPPIAELTAAALIVAGLSVALRIAIPVIPTLILGDSSELSDVVIQFRERLPGVIIPFACTISLGLLCTYLGARPWSQLQIATLGAIGNGLAFMAAALVVAWLLRDDVLAQFYAHPQQARPLVVITSGLIGLAIGAMVLAAFKRSERAHQDIVEQAAEGVRAGIPGLAMLPPAEDLDPAAQSRSDVAAPNYGGYSRANAAHLEGCYVCFRPAFTLPGVITAYLMDLRWDDTASCLTFEESGRADAGHTQRGRVYIPDGRPFISFVTVERGGIRLVTVSRPEQGESARGLIMSLSNPGGMHFTPVSAPIVLRRIVDKVPQLGFIRPDAPDYESYRRELEAVAPAFGFFAAAPRPAAGAQARRGTEEVRLSLVT